MSTETTISLILFLGALLLVWRTRRGLVQEREKALALEAEPESAGGMLGSLEGQRPPEPVAVLETPTLATTGVKPETLATQETAGETIPKVTVTTRGKPKKQISGKQTAETIARPVKKTGAEPGPKPVVNSDAGPAPKPMAFIGKEPVENTALERNEKAEIAEMEEPGTKKEIGAGRDEISSKPPGTEAGKEPWSEREKTGTGADTSISTGSVGEPAMAPAIEIPPEDETRSENQSPASRNLLPERKEGVRDLAVEMPSESGSAPRTPTAGEASRHYALEKPALINPAVKNSAVKKPPVKNPADGSPPAKNPPGKTD